MLEQLQSSNKNITILPVTDESFSLYGSVLLATDFFDAIDYLREQTTIPDTGNKYVAHDEVFEQSIASKKPYQNIFGDILLEFGYVNGKNSHLNALEYHKSPEINICITPLVLLLGRSSDLHDGTFDATNLKAFYIPKNTVIQINPYTFHFSPCKTSDSGFKCGVILPYGTNMDFPTKPEVKSFEDRLLFKHNKWLIAHPDNQKLVDQGAVIGITGNNIEIKY